MLRMFIVLSVLAVVLGVPSVSYACRCKMPTSSYSYKKAELVLRVKVSSVNKIADELETVDVSVTDAWKQNAPTSLKIMAGGKVCGYFFEEGKEYIVYLKKNENGEWSTANCVGNKVIGDPSFPLFTKLAEQDAVWLQKNGRKGAVQR